MFLEKWRYSAMWISEPKRGIRMSWMEFGVSVIGEKKGRYLGVKGYLKDWNIFWDWLCMSRLILCNEYNVQGRYYAESSEG